MLRWTTMFIISGVFLIAVMLGVNLSVARFNQTVLPPEPVKPFKVEEQANRLRIDLVGETINVNLKAIKNKLVAYQELGQQQWTEARDNYLDPKLSQVLSETRRQLDRWLKSDQVKAVNGWIKDKLKHKGESL